MNRVVSCTKQKHGFPDCHLLGHRRRRHAHPPSFTKNMRNHSAWGWIHIVGTGGLEDLVGGAITILKNMKVNGVGITVSHILWNIDIIKSWKIKSMGRDYPIYEMEVIKAMFESSNQGRMSETPSSTRTGRAYSVVSEVVDILMSTTSQFSRPQGRWASHLRPTGDFMGKFGGLMGLHWELQWDFTGKFWWDFIVIPSPVHIQHLQETVVDVVRAHMNGTYWNHRMKLFSCEWGMEPWVLHGSGPGPSSCVIFPAILGYVAALPARTCFPWYLHIQSLMLTQESLTIHMGTIPHDNVITVWGSQHSSARSMRP